MSGSKSSNRVSVITPAAAVLPALVTAVSTLMPVAQPRAAEPMVLIRSSALVRDPSWGYTLHRYRDITPNAPTLATPAARGPAPAAAAPTIAARPPAGRPIETAAIARPSNPGAPMPSLNGPSHSLAGLASYYWQPQMTANGEVFNPRQLTAAHKTLPFNTRVRVTEVRTGRSVIVRINDRGPFKPGRVIDLSQAAAEHLGMQSQGITPVRIEIVGR